LSRITREYQFLSACGRVFDHHRIEGERVIDFFEKRYQVERMKYSVIIEVLRERLAESLILLGNPTAQVEASHVRRL
jgi:hypothetical protein